MMPDRIKIPSAFWVGADRLNIGRSAILRGAGLPASVAREDASVSTEQFFALWRALETLLGPEAGLRLAQAWTDRSCRRPFWSPIMQGTTATPCAAWPASRLCARPRP